MTDGMSSADFQMPLIDGTMQGEFAYLNVDDRTLTPDEDMASGELSASDFADVRDRGMLVPIIVVPGGANALWQYEVKDGRRRLRAARKLFAAGLEQFRAIPALIYPTYCEEDMETLPSNLNARRSPNPMSDLESIQAVMAFMYDFKSLP